MCACWLLYNTSSLPHLFDLITFLIIILFCFAYLESIWSLYSRSKHVSYECYWSTTSRHTYHRTNSCNKFWKLKWHSSDYELDKKECLGSKAPLITDKYCMFNWWWCCCYWTNIWMKGWTVGSVKLTESMTKKYRRFKSNCAHAVHAFLTTFLFISLALALSLHYAYCFLLPIKHDIMRRYLHRKYKHNIAEYWFVID